MLRWWRSRRAGAEPETVERPFDASIDIGRPDAAEAVRRRVMRIAGAGWVSVEAHPGAAVDVRLFEKGTSIELVGAAWETLRREVEGEVWAALDEVREPEVGWEIVTPKPSGFAEGAAASPFEALEQLAALATLARPAPAMPEPVLPTAPPPVVRVRAKPVEIPTEDAIDVGRLVRLLGLVLPTDPLTPAVAAVRRFGSYPAVLAAPEAELRAVPGLGTHSIAAIKLIHAAAIRFARAGVATRPVLSDRQRLHDYLAAALARERIEQFRILFLDENGMLRADEVQAQGTVNHTPVYPREVVRRALALEAAAIVLVHNHPSGDPAPSREDIEMTKTVREAARVMKISLRDHLIVGNGRWLSFRDEGLLN